MNEDYVDESDGGRVIDTGVQALQPLDVKWIWDYDYLWLRVEADFRNGTLYRDKNTGAWAIKLRKDGSDPFMNERGIREVMALLRANCNVVTGSSIYREDIVMQRCEETGLMLTNFLQSHREEFGISVGKLQAIVVTFMNAFEANLRKSIEGTALKYALQGERVIESRQTGNAQQAGGLLNRAGRLLGVG